MNEEEAVNELKRIKKMTDNGGDLEEPHDLADKILLNFVPPAVAKAWDEIPKWYA